MLSQNDLKMKKNVYIFYGGGGGVQNSFLRKEPYKYVCPS